MKKVCLMLLISCVWSSVAWAKEADLQQQIDQADDGEVITLASKVYEGPIVIDKPLTIKGQNGTVIKGNGTGNVVTITADDVTIQTVAIQSSGRQKQDAGIEIKKVNDVKLQSLQLTHVQNGIFVRGGTGHMIMQNQVSSYEGHFATRGNGIHLLAAANVTVSQNDIHSVQDGVYLDQAMQITMTSNNIQQSRYGIHFMFSKEAEAVDNAFYQNITGVMAMNSESIVLERNTFEKQLDFRGYGVLIFEMKDVLMRHNQLFYNQTGVGIQSSQRVQVDQNTFAGNSVALASSGSNQDVSIHDNTFVGNITQTRLTGDPIQLYERGRGNEWDDDRSFDVTGDGIGEVPYRAQSSSAQWIQKHPHLQFYFESPVMTLWDAMERFFAREQDWREDRYPIVKGRNT